MKVILRYFLIFVLQSFIVCQTTRKKPKIAVIGAGVGGASATHFLQQLFIPHYSDLKIHVYEGNIVGGRLRTIEMIGRQYEAGGSIIHSRNKYMVEFVEMLGLGHQDVSGNSFGLFNGKNYLFKESSWQILTFLKLVWRYGSDIFRLKSLIDEMISKLSRVYNHQDDGLAYTSVENLLNSMDETFVKMTHTSVGNYLRNQGFDDLIITELGEAAMRTNYGQSTETVHGFVGLVSLAGVGFELWRVKEGNHRVPDLLISKSGAKLIQSNVTRVKLLNDAKYELTDSFGHKEVYDLVVVATPLTKDLCNIKFEGFSNSIAPVQGLYHRTVATFVQGKRNLKNLHLNGAKIEEILTTADVKLFSSFALNSPVNVTNDPKRKESGIYKIFSNSLLSEQDLDYLFVERQLTKVVDWKAYPQYEFPQPLGGFILHDPGLFYTNAIEFSASAMEMSAISGRNAALLAFNIWFKHSSKIDVPLKEMKRYQSEL